MTELSNRDMIIGGGLLLAVGALWWLLQPGNAASLGGSVGAAAVNFVTGTAAGAVNTVVGDMGLAVNASQCHIDLTKGNTLGAITSCTASDFLAYELHGTIPP